jgi:hypothetical protein
MLTEKEDEFEIFIDWLDGILLSILFHVPNHQNVIPNDPSCKDRAIMLYDS